MTNAFVESLTPVESFALSTSPFELSYFPSEKSPLIITSNFPLLGKLTAIRFIEWVQNNPEGVVSLPTGKSPEYFIKWFTRIISNWDQKSITEMLSQWGVDITKRPNTRGLHFVQIDEFYPISPLQTNSFYHYVKKYYIDGFGMDERRAMLIDCTTIGMSENESLHDVWPNLQVDLSLRFKAPTTNLERRQKELLSRIDQWCQEYEEKIRNLGGIGFFLGGIGPDGHVGFNCRGSNHLSVTRLTNVNYETQAASASDLGGIEVARNRLVITIGLGTITYNPNCVAIIMAAGEAKARVIADAVHEDTDVKYPATALRKLKSFRMYITSGAAKRLTFRQTLLLKSEAILSNEQIDALIIDTSKRIGKPLQEVSAEDFQLAEEGKIILEKSHTEISGLLKQATDHILDKIRSGSKVHSHTRFLHLEPHHDDIMLGYLPAVVRNIRDPSNFHYFATLTSGFTAVTNQFMLELLRLTSSYINRTSFPGLLSSGYFRPCDIEGRNQDVWLYLDGIASGSEEMKVEGQARRMVRALFELFGIHDKELLQDHINSLEQYFTDSYPGKKDPSHIQTLKGMVREWEAECLWGYFGWNCRNMSHLRLGFYSGDTFTEEPTRERDALPVLELLEQVKPDIVTVALDPEGAGPDTHYKALQAVAEALRMYTEKTNAHVKVWGYRNIWYRFHPAEANLYVPVSLNMFSILTSAFSNAFVSQRNASFPSYEHDGPFSELAIRIQTDQYQLIKGLIGNEFFYNNPSPLIRATRGLVFLKEMDVEELLCHCRALQKATEGR